MCMNPDEEIPYTKHVEMAELYTCYRVKHSFLFSTNLLERGIPFRVPFVVDRSKDLLAFTCMTVKELNATPETLTDHH
jgi:hypothetical protein